MASCRYCDSTILFGGKRHGDLSFCNDECMQNGMIAILGSKIPDDEVAKRAAELHRGPCPKCQGEGPVDLHTTHRIWSAVVMTSWSNRPLVSCARCANIQRGTDLVFCTLLGWWGFPWGILMTPVQIGRNLFGFFGGPMPQLPSKALQNIVRIQLTTIAIQQGRIVA